MKKVWIKVDPFDKKIVTSAIEGGAEGIIIEEGYAKDAKKLGRIKTVAKDGDLIPGKDIKEMEISGQEDEAKILSESRKNKVIINTNDWKIIPLENLIAQDADVIFRVTDANEAKTAFQILEKGVTQILFHPSSAVELKNFFSDIAQESEKIELETAAIVSVAHTGMGDRVCIDTCTMMTPGQGILVGNSNKALFLIHAESIENPYVAPRPFRVNAGPVHAYTRVGGGKTRYLSELQAGDPVLITDASGHCREAVTGRLKIEKRPLMLVKAEKNGEEFSVLVQNAETIRLVSEDGSPRSVVDLKPGDTVLVAFETAARHFGHSIKESIKEK